MAEGYEWWRLANVERDFVPDGWAANNNIPRLRAEVTGVIMVLESKTSVGLFSLDSCWGVPMIRNSVLLRLRDRRLHDIQDEILVIVSWNWTMLDANDCGENDKYRWVSSAYKWWFTDEFEIRLLRGVVYIINSNGPNTEPWGTPQNTEKDDDFWPEAETTDERDARYERNHERAESEIPNQADRRCNKIVWSMVSNAAERSNKQRQDTCCFAVACISESWTDRSAVSVEWNLL